MENILIYFDSWNIASSGMIGGGTVFEQNFKFSKISLLKNVYYWSFNIDPWVTNQGKTLK